MSKLEIIPAEDADLSLDLKRLDPALREKVKKLEERTRYDISQFGKFALKVGKDLSEMHELLEPQRVFTYWLRRIPNMSVSTAYRIMGGYQRVKDNFPPIVTELALAGGIPMFGTTKRAPFGKYTEIIPQLGKPPSDAEGAQRWLQEMKQLQASNQKPRNKGALLELLAGQIARAYLRDRRAGPFRDWLGKVSALAQEQIKERAEE